MLGVCLGDQLLGFINNFNVLRTPVPKNGLKYHIAMLNNTDPIFNNMPNAIEVVRHHLLIFESINTNSLFMPLVCMW